ncbi:toprim domain-containing protein [Acidovorax sp. SD340]|uniref:toprim domain-containing protein n=1 Tax=Acidovorax sp. SD340 TaxID=1690268 RepID=UPI0006DC1B39|nr:toprim domain-containing protein [Acidovorax sp. SD340]KQB59346.1 hypothetical protein AE621_10495 [Acidovorax sp. SD340]MBO1007119.1 toprim domain-containing protein [Acidovorax sp. SD340]
MNFETTLAAAGFIPRAVIADGKWRRCATLDKPKKRNGAYVLHPDGRGYFRNWATDSDVSAWADGSADRAPVIDPVVLDRRRAEERRARQMAMQGARARWADSAPLRGLHPYLERKGLSAIGCNTLRVYRGQLVVPVYWGNTLTSIQTISEDGVKRFWPGAPVKGGALVLERPRAAVTAICEGLATGLAVYQSLRHATVIVAFDAGNLIHVVDRIRPTGSVVICADNDHATELKRGTNPGREKAANAAELIGAGVAWPEDIEGTDWADALAEWGIVAHKRIERQVLAKARYVAPTG